MSKKDRAALIATSLLAAACTRAATSPPLQPAEIDAGVMSNASAPSPHDAGAPDLLFPRAVALLAPYALTHADPPRRTVYTWTTHEQRVALEKTPRLLTREESPTKGSAYLDQVLSALAKKNDPIAKILYTSTFAKMRYAWHAPWATREGWPGEQYGDELVAVTLKPDAIILSLSTAMGAFTAQDLAGHSIALDDVAKNKSRITGIYFVSDATAPAAAGVAPPTTTTYREIALCNESMIESWSLGTVEIAKELDENAAALEAFAAYLRTIDELPDAAPLVQAWTDTPERAPIPLYRAALAFDNELYKTDATTLLAIAAHLRAAPRGLALSHVPDMKFPGAGSTRAAPVVKQVPRGTFSTFGRP